ncbi:MAG: carbohydrate binding family 9 domain-containing protein [Planctomycetes bacterium]|nr:carbohydrate binding family 9 domain-containing protein [Planctomycetota bacterium]
MLRVTTFIICIFGGSIELSAQNSAQAPVKQAKISVVDQPPVLDGRLDDVTWQTATQIGDFTEVKPNEGQIADPETVCYIARDANFLYIAFECFDNDTQSMVLQNVARDAFLTDDDRIEIVLDTFNNKQSAYFFQMSAAGSRGDALIGENGRRFNKPWNGFWQGASLVHDDKWVCEMAIPFATLSSGESDTWGFNMQRYRGSSRSEYRWSAPRREVFLGNVSIAGELGGFSGLKHGLGLEFRPYLKTKRVDQHDGAEGFETDFGGEIHWAITPALKASFSLNTDFAETEVDDRKVNLSRFSTFYPEKRDFFLQDSNLFEFGEQSTFGGRGSNNLLPFFSRSIGLSSGQPVDINYAARIAGRLDKFDIAALAAHTSNDFELGVPEGELFVLRPSYHLSSAASIGGLFTTGNPNSIGSNSVGGVDFHYSSADVLGSNFSLNTFFVQSADGDSGQRGLGFGAQASLAQPEFEASFASIGAQSDFLPAMGYVRRPGEFMTKAMIKYKPLTTNSDVRQYDFLIGPEVWMNLGGDLISSTFRLGLFGAEFHDGTSIKFHTKLMRDRPDSDYSVASGVTMLAGDYAWTEHMLKYATSSRNKFSVSSYLSGGQYYDGHIVKLNTSLTYRPSASSKIKLSYGENRGHLPAGDFTTRVEKLTFDLSFGPKVAWDTLLQADNQSDTLGIQSRLRYLLEDGREMFFVVDSGWQELENRMIVPTQHDLTLKLVYALRF